MSSPAFSAAHLTTRSSNLRSESLDLKLAVIDRSSKIYLNDASPVTFKMQRCSRRGMYPTSIIFLSLLLGHTGTITPRLLHDCLPTAHSPTCICSQICVFLVISAPIFVRCAKTVQLKSQLYSFSRCSCLLFFLSSPLHLTIIASPLDLRHNMTPSKSMFCPYGQRLFHFRLRTALSDRYGVRSCQQRANGYWMGTGTATTDVLMYGFGDSL